MRVSQYSKSIVMVLAAGLGIYMSANSDGVVTPLEYVNIIIAILGAVLVYLLPNLPTGVAKYTKTIVAFSTAAATALAVVVANLANFDQVSQSDWISIFLAGLAAIGLYIVPNTSGTPAVTVVNSDDAGVVAGVGGEEDPSAAIPEDNSAPSDDVDSIPAV